MSFGDQYSSQEAHFIAGGKTLEIIKQYEADSKNPKALQKALAEEYGAIEFQGTGSYGSFLFKEPTNNPAFIDKEKRKSDKGFYYEINRKTPEGQALQKKLDLIPDFDLSFGVFALRLTGVEDVPTNPDNLHDSNGYSSSPYREKGSARSATFRKYGDTYVVSVPRIIRGIFNEESKKASIEDHYDQAAGWTFEWFTPPDSKQIPYSKVVELREQSLGDQLKPAVVKAKVPAFSREG